MKEVFTIITEIIYILCGVVAISTGVRGLKNKEKAIGTFAFWTIVGLLFMLGKHIPYKVTGGAIVVLAGLTLTKQVKMGEFAPVSFEARKKMADLHKNKIFIPALLIGVLSFLLLQFRIGGAKVPTAVGLGVAAIIALAVAALIFKPSVKESIEDTNKMVMQVGPFSLLPQLLTGLGAVFAAAGIGNLIADSFSVVIPAGNHFVAIAIYCIAMAVFTMLMGNAFAAFTVITTGLAVPFLLQSGANIAVVGALGMTAGYCGTLMTPMAANFNIVPAGLMEIQDTSKIIKTQAKLGLPLLAMHILFMYLFAF